MGERVPLPVGLLCVEVLSRRTHIRKLRHDGQVTTPPLTPHTALLPTPLQ